MPQDRPKRPTRKRRKSRERRNSRPGDQWIVTVKKRGVVSAPLGTEIERVDVHQPPIDGTEIERVDVHQPPIDGTG